MIVLAPWLLGRVGARVALVIYAGWQGAMLLGLSLSTSLPLLYLFGLGLGVSFGTGTQMMGSYLITTWFVARRGAVLGSVMAISGFGGIAVGLGMPPLLGAVGWQGAFRLLALHGTRGGAQLRAAILEGAPGTQRHRHPPLAAAARRR